MNNVELKYLEEKYNLLRIRVNMHLNNKDITKALEVIEEAKPILEKITNEKIRRKNDLK